jgi:hypothetical protein
MINGSPEEYGMKKRLTRLEQVVNIHTALISALFIIIIILIGMLIVLSDIHTR